MTETVHNRRKLLGWMLFGATVLIISSGTGYVYAYRDRMAPRTQINGVSIGYMTKAEATSVITRHEDAFLRAPLRMNYPGGVITVQPKLLGLTFNTASALDLAYANADQQALPLRVRQLLTSPFHSHNYPDFVYPISDTGRAYLRQALPSSVEQPATETSLSFIPNATTVNAGIAGHLVDLLALSRALANAYSSHSSSISLELTTFQPTVSLAGAQTALTQAQSLLSTPWIVQIGSQTLGISEQEFAKVLNTSVVPATNEAPASLSLGVQPEALQALVTSLAKLSDRVASNALLSVVNGAVVVTQPDVDGLVVNQPAVLSAITLAIATPPISHKIESQTTLTKAAIRSETLASAGVTQLIGTATTDFAGSPTNRVFNITLGQKSLNGILIADGAEFSTVGSLGPIDGAHGYKPELSIVNNRTVLEDGGGLCQVSTTLFRTVLNAGLPVTERVNHAYRVGYYEVGVGPGLDATIYDPAPDFKWKNDTGHTVYVESHIVGTKITFELYGTSDGRTAQISAPNIISETPPGDPIYSNTDTLPKGTTKQVEHPHPGAVTAVTYTVMHDGQPVRTQTFKSTYRPWPAQFLVGTS